MSKFLEKLNKQAEIRNEVDGHIWGIFHRYIKDYKINFNSPDTWSYDIDDEGILFEGTDGCMGCYDSMSISIKLKYFEYYDDCIVEKLALEKKEEDEQKRKNDANRKRLENIKHKKELAIYERIKKEKEKEMK